MGKSASKSRDLRRVNIKNLAKTTQFSSKQLKAWYIEFLKDCPEGAMTKEIFMENFGDFFFPNDVNVKRLADYVFNRFDTNKDGVITFDEFINAVSIPTRGTIDEKLDWAFSVYDSDDDGYITKEEMLNIVRAVYERKGLPLEKCNVAQKKVETIFHQMDSNSDGMLSREEFIEGFKNDPLILRSLLAKKET